MGTFYYLSMCKIMYMHFDRIQSKQRKGDSNMSAFDKGIGYESIKKELMERTFLTRFLHFFEYS